MSTALLNVNDRRESDNDERAARSRTTLSDDGRIEMLDAARAVAAMVVVLNHTALLVGKAPPLVSFSVPFYLILAISITAKRSSQDGFRAGGYLRARAARLYVPLLFWFFVPTVLTWAVTLASGHMPGLRLRQDGTIHLYFLHLLMFGTALFVLLDRVADWGGRRIRQGLAAATALAAVVVCLIPTPSFLLNYSGIVGQTLASSWNSLPGLFVAIALALATRGTLFKRAASSRLAYVGIAICLATVAVKFLAYASTGASRSAETESWQIFRAARALGGVGFLMIAFAPWRSPLVSVLAAIGRHSFGIYLAHLTLLGVVFQLYGVVGIPRGAMHLPDIAALSFVLSLSLTILFSKSRWLSWTVGATPTRTKPPSPAAESPAAPPRVAVAQVL